MSDFERDVKIRQLQGLLGARIIVGTGAPTADPGGAALYFREDFAVGAAVYGWDGSWNHLW